MIDVLSSVAVGTAVDADDVLVEVLREVESPSKRLESADSSSSLPVATPSIDTEDDQIEEVDISHMRDGRVSTAAVSPGTSEEED
jgi:hypothetical protein